MTDKAKKVLVTIAPDGKKSFAKVFITKKITSLDDPFIVFINMFYEKKKEDDLITIFFDDVYKRMFDKGKQ